MANNYRQWSEVLRLSADTTVFAEQKKWLVEVLADAEKDEPEEFVARLQAHNVGTDNVDQDFWPDFEWELRADSEGNYLWLYAEETGNLEHLGAVVGAFLLNFYPTGVFTLQWADYCSRLRVGAFGGGGMVVRAASVRIMSTDQMIHDVVTSAEEKEGPCDSPPK